MRKLILAIGVVLLLASFTQNTNTIILKDIDGTLLKSYPVIEQISGEYTITFTVDANTVVTSNTVDDATHIYLVESGSSNSTVTHTLTFDASSVDFTNYFKSNYDVASTDNTDLVRVRTSSKPRKILS